MVLSVADPAVCRIVLALLFELEPFTATYLVAKATHSSTDGLLNHVQTAGSVSAIVTARVRMETHLNTLPASMAQLAEGSEGDCGRVGRTVAEEGVG